MATLRGMQEGAKQNLTERFGRMSEDRQQCRKAECKKKLPTGIETNHAARDGTISTAEETVEREEGPRGGAAEKEGWVPSSSPSDLGGRTFLAQH